MFESLVEHVPSRVALPGGRGRIGRGHRGYQGQGHGPPWRCRWRTLGRRTRSGVLVANGAELLDVVRALEPQGLRGLLPMALLRGRSSPRRIAVVSVAAAAAAASALGPVRLAIAVVSVAAAAAIAVVSVAAMAAFIPPAPCVLCAGRGGLTRHPGGSCGSRIMRHRFGTTNATELSLLLSLLLL